jgi:hypothetical protein
MELKKISSAGDPELVERNKKRIDPLLPSIIAILMQTLATVYLYHAGSPIKSVISSGVLTIIYCMVAYLLNSKPKKSKGV